MGLVVTVPPTTEPVSLAEALDHLRLEQDAPDSGVVQGFLQVARESFEHVTARCLMPQTLRYTADGFPPDDYEQPMYLPRAPVTAVSQIQYLDYGAQLQTLDPATYVVDIESLPPRVGLGYAKVWPPTIPLPQAVRITFTAGYADAASVPASAKAAIKLLLGELYENRERVLQGAPVQELPAYRALAAQHWVPVGVG